ncbi:MAG: GNAT family N-acetyltransferase [Candidatus Woesearchaeota archaeon]|nr:MAG: GNAT family N-acetyltransferase [Candidatus Woesearchaeota archaeon]
MALPDKQLIMKAPTLETKRLMLRPFTLRDAKAVSTRGWVDKKKNILINTEVKARAFLKSNILSSTDGYYLAVFLKETDELVGDLEFCHLDWYRFYYGELCYGFAERHWGKGYATESAKALVDYLFRKINVPKITADTDPDNFASQKVLYKLHFKIEGVARKKNFDKKKKMWLDEYNWGLLRDEWLITEKKPLCKLIK